MSATPTPTPSPTGPPPAPRRPAARVIALLTAAFGVVVVIVTAIGGTAPSLAVAGTTTQNRTADVSGVLAVDADIDATSFSLRFDDVDEAVLEVRDAPGGEWVFERERQTLHVRAPRPFFWGWGWSAADNGTATLTLPRELEDRFVDLDLSSDAGRAVIDGTFGELAIEMGAGGLTATGSANALVVEVGAGRADLDLTGVSTARLSLSAGETVARLRGDAPEEVTTSVSAGTLDLTLPEDDYAVTSEVVAGDFDNGLRIDRRSSHRVSVEVAVGSARIVSE